MSKRLISIFLMIVMLIYSCCVTEVYADESVKLTAKTTNSINAGDYIDIDFDLGNVPSTGIIAVYFYVDFDTDLIPSGASYSEAFQFVTTDAWEVSYPLKGYGISGHENVQLDTSNYETGLTADANIGKLRIKTNPNLATGTKRVKISNISITPLGQAAITLDDTIPVDISITGTSSSDGDNQQQKEEQKQEEQKQEQQQQEEQKQEQKQEEQKNPNDSSNEKQEEKTLTQKDQPTQQQTETSVQQTNLNGTETTAASLPNAGKKELILKVVAILVIVAIIFYKKVKDYNIK